MRTIIATVAAALLALVLYLFTYAYCDLVELSFENVYPGILVLFDAVILVQIVCVYLILRSLRKKREGLEKPLSEEKKEQSVSLSEKDKKLLSVIAMICVPVLVLLLFHVAFFFFIGAKWSEDPYVLIYSAYFIACAWILIQTIGTSAILKAIERKKLKNES